MREGAGGYAEKEEQQSEQFGRFPGGLAWHATTAFHVSLQICSCNTHASLGAFNKCCSESSTVMPHVPNSMLFIFALLSCSNNYYLSFINIYVFSPPTKPFEKRAELREKSAGARRCEIKLPQFTRGIDRSVGLFIYHCAGYFLDMCLTSLKPNRDLSSRSMR